MSQNLVSYKNKYNFILIYKIENIFLNNTDVKQ